MPNGIFITGRDRHRQTDRQAERGWAGTQALTEAECGAGTETYRDAGGQTKADRQTDGRPGRQRYYYYGWLATQQQQQYDLLLLLLHLGMAGPLEASIDYCVAL